MAKRAEDHENDQVEPRKMTREIVGEVATLLGITKPKARAAVRLVLYGVLADLACCRRSLECDGALGMVARTFSARLLYTVDRVLERSVSERARGS